MIDVIFTQFAHIRTDMRFVLFMLYNYKHLYNFYLLDFTGQCDSEFAEI